MYRAGYGFADMVFIPKKGYDVPVLVIELKWNNNADTAIAQIKEKKYPDCLSGYRGSVLLVGISYDKSSIEAGHRRRIEKVEG